MRYYFPVLAGILPILIAFGTFAAADAREKRAQEQRLPYPDSETLPGGNIVRKYFKGKSGGISYCLITENMTRSGTPSMVLILHGKSGCGTDNTRQLTSPAVKSLLDFVRSSGEKVIIIAPQCPPDRDWVRGGAGSMLAVAAELTAEQCREFRIPPEKTYITGVSMGGGACYAMMSSCPGMFAKAIVVSAGGRPSSAAGLNGGFYIVHGENDRLIPVEKARETARALAQDRKNQVIFKSLPGKGHVDGAQAACTKECWRWLFRQNNQNRGRSAAVQAIPVCKSRSHT